MTYLAHSAPAPIVPERRRTWLVTGAAGFLGSHLVEHLLRAGQNVRAVDNFSTGRAENVRRAAESAIDVQVQQDEQPLDFVAGDVTDPSIAEQVVRGVDIVVHLAALSSCRQSIAEPLAFHSANVGGFATIVDAARRAGVPRVVYGSCCSVYGDDESPIKVEHRIGRPLTPHAAGKRETEFLAGVMARLYGLTIVGLRYFTVYGPRQSGSGPYASVVPSWIERLMRSETCSVFSSLDRARDFVFVDDAVRATVLAATAPVDATTPAVFNVGSGTSTTLGELLEQLRRCVRRPASEPQSAGVQTTASPSALYDSCPASLRSIGHHLGFRPAVSLADGLARTVAWHERTGAGKFVDAA